MKTQGNGRVFIFFRLLLQSMQCMNGWKTDTNKVGLLHGKLSAFIETKFEDDDLVDEKLTRNQEQYKNTCYAAENCDAISIVEKYFCVKRF